MLRATFVSLVGWSLVLTPALSFGQGAWGAASYLEPESYPQQARARLDDEGQIVLTCVLAEPFPATIMREEKRVRVVRDGDEEKTVEETVLVASTAMKIATHKEEYRLPLTDGVVFDLEGKPVKASAAAARLKKGAPVLFASRLMPAYYLTVFKSDTLFLKVGPESRAFEAPKLPQAEDGAEAGAALGEPGVAPSEPRAAPGEPAAGPQAPPEFVDEQLPIPPQVALAKAAGNLVAIRSYIKEVETEKMFLEEPADDGKVTRQEFDVQTETIIDIERRFPGKSIKATRADGKPVPPADLAKLLAASRCVLLAGDAKKVDPSYLEIVRPDALILTSPQAQLAHPQFAPPPGPAPIEPAPAEPR